MSISWEHTKNITYLKPDMFIASWKHFIVLVCLSFPLSTKLVDKNEMESGEIKKGIHSSYLIKNTSHNRSITTFQMSLGN